MADSGARSRRLAAMWLEQVRAGHALPDAMLQVRQDWPPAAKSPPAELAFARRLTHQVLYARNRLEARLAPALRRPPQPGWIQELLLVGLAQLEDPECPQHAAVAATVEAAPKALRGLVNAILRKATRGELLLPSAQVWKPSLTAGLPEWLHAQIKADWGARAEEIIAASNTPSPMGLRVNRQRAERDTICAQLRQRGAEVERVGEWGLSLAQSIALESWPAFAEGQVSVQNPAAQCAAELLPVAPGLRVLDACAAPGGKTAHLLEREPELDLVALDISAERLRDVERGLQRLGLHCSVEAESLQAHAGSDYAAILLDVPCSATGILRRHPDIRWLRRASDIPALVAEQAALLRRAWSLLAAEGTLLYASCSILRAETEAVVQAFLAQTPEAIEEPFTLPAGEALSVGWRIPPGGAWDGFYYARLRKQPAGRKISP